MENIENQNTEVIPRDNAKIMKIWKTAGILAIITAAEFVLAFTVGRGAFLFITFILMTLAKAFFIVAEFMHLAHERKALILSVLLPTIFLFWAILAFMMEGSYILADLKELWGYFVD
jgi:cytochrome c oxidase subunit IV